MNLPPRDSRRDQLTAKLTRFWKTEGDHARIADMIRSMDARYDLIEKTTQEQDVFEVVTEMVARLANSFRRLSEIEGKTFLDIPCGSNSSRAPAPHSFNARFSPRSSRWPTSGYAAQFEPWFCRILFEFGAAPVGVDIGDLEGESFTHYRVDLGDQGALDFLPSGSFDAVQDSRLFGSPEFTAQFPNQADRLKVAREIVRQEQRLLKPGGVVIHSDAADLLSYQKKPDC